MLSLADVERAGRRNALEGGADGSRRSGFMKVRERRRPYWRTATNTPIGRHFECGGGWLPLRDLFLGFFAGREFLMIDQFIFQ
jgi:hypothetical protein